MDFFLAQAKENVKRAVEVLQGQNSLLTNHPNANLYTNLQGLVEFDGFYLESEPCLVCNDPEVQFTNIKLSAIKVSSGALLSYYHPVSGLTSWMNDG